MRPFILLSSAWLLTIAASAQTSSPVRSSATSSGGLLGGVITPAGSVASGAGWTLSSVGPEVPGYTATGAPYSAVQITEHTQTLADGTHITQPVQTTKFYRDSQGRTRIERSFPVPPGALANGTDAPSFIEISDPVAGFRYTLEARNHTAHRMAMAATPPPSVTANNGSPAKTIRLLPAQITPLYLLPRRVIKQLAHNFPTNLWERRRLKVFWRKDLAPRLLIQSGPLAMTGR